MENNILITDTSHNKIYQTYAELKKKLPPTFFKIKVFSTPKYNFDKKPILKKIENDKINNLKTEKSLSINKYNPTKNIYILSNKTIKFKNPRILNPILFNEQKSDELLKKTLLTEKDKNINNDTEQNKNNNYDYGEDEELEYQGYYFHSNIIKDVHMKNNIYLPKIIDRMKYNIPRNERDKNGFHIKGIGIFSNNKNKYNEINDNNNYEYNIKNNNKDNVDSDKDIFESNFI